jgi:hypothetical protein
MGYPASIPKYPVRHPFVPPDSQFEIASHQAWLGYPELGAGAGGAVCGGGVGAVEATGGEVVLGGDSVVGGGGNEVDVVVVEDVVVGAVLVELGTDLVATVCVADVLVASRMRATTPTSSNNRTLTFDRTRRLLAGQ